MGGKHTSCDSHMILLQKLVVFGGEVEKKMDASLEKYGTVIPPTNWLPWCAFLNFYNVSEKNGFVVVEQFRASQGVSFCSMNFAMYEPLAT